MTEGTAETAGLIISAVEEFAQELAAVIRRFLELQEWHGTQRIAVGGGLPLLVTALGPGQELIYLVPCTSLFSLRIG